MFRSLFVRRRFYVAIWGISFLFLISFFVEPLFLVAWIVLGVFSVLLFFDLVQLFGPGTKSGVTGTRHLPIRFSNGDANEVILEIENLLTHALKVEVIDEIPYQFQKRDFAVKTTLKSRQPQKFSYSLTPVERGVYSFGRLHLFVWNLPGFFSRRYSFCSKDVTVKVYPSFIQMRQFEIMAVGNRLSEMGVKKIRRIGHHSEFDQIRDYIKGDDVRTINWMATARKGHLMVNQYQDEKSQPVFSIIDMGRTMKMPFNGMTLLDYAINTSLVISNIALLKHDKAGLITFDHQVRAVLPANRGGNHLQTIMEVLYQQTPGFLEHNLEALYTAVRRQVHQRSLLIFYTNFESWRSARRELFSLSRLAANHLLLVVFFENSEISSQIHQVADDTETIYQQAIAEKFVYDKKMIVRELERYGMSVILTTPGKLTVDTVNRYLELKALGRI